MPSTRIKTTEGIREDGEAQSSLVAQQQSACRWLALFERRWLQVLRGHEIAVG